MGCRSRPRHTPLDFALLYLSWLYMICTCIYIYSAFEISRDRLNATRADDKKGKVTDRIGRE